jgi:phosphate transport system protein
MELLEIYEALTLMGKEVRLQVDAAISAFRDADPRGAEAVIERDDVIDNLNTMIEERCFEYLHAMERDEFRIKQVKGAYRLAINLEKVGDYAGNIATQALHLARLVPIARPVDLGPLATLVQAAIDEAVTGFVKRDIALAKQACQREAELDRGYGEILQNILALLQEPGAPVHPLVTHLFAAKYLERIGDSVLNIGEMTIYLITGQRLKLEQYLALERMVDFIQNHSQTPGASLDFRSLWGGISGARLARVQVDAHREYVFKEGASRKIHAEMEKAEAWNRIVPGVVPLAQRHLREDGRDALLREFLVREGRGDLPPSGAAA